MHGDKLKLENTNDFNIIDSRGKRRTAREIVKGLYVHGSYGTPLSTPHNGVP